jgi:hypothetical protein
MDHFVTISTFNDQRITNLVCACLESRDLPVMIEHVHGPRDTLYGAAFRILVPAQSSQLAMEILAGLGSTRLGASATGDISSEIENATL